MEEGGGEEDAYEGGDPDEIVEEGITLRKGEQGENVNLLQWKDTLIRISRGDMDGLSFDQYSGDQRILQNGNNILYSDEDFMYAFFNLSGSMQRIYSVEAYSTDNGRTWYVNGKAHWNGWIYILDRRIIKTDGWYKAYQRAVLGISFAYGESYSQGIYIPSVDDILSLPGINDSCYCYGEAYAASKWNNLFCVRWVMKSMDSDDSYYISMVFERDVDYTTLDTLAERDLTGLARFAARFRETGFLFPDSSTELLDPETVEEHFEREFSISSSQQVTWEAELAVSEIYARKGADYSGMEYEEYFGGKSRYDPAPGTGLQDMQLSEIEAANIELLRSFQNKYDSSSPDAE